MFQPLIFSINFLKTGGNVNIGLSLTPVEILVAPKQILKIFSENPRIDEAINLSIMEKLQFDGLYVAIGGWRYLC